MPTFLVPDKTTNFYGINVKEYFLTNHNPNNIALPSVMNGTPIGVTIHNTDDINQAAGTTDAEQYTRATVNGNMGTVRVHFYVDGVEAWQNLPFTQQSWHCGQKGKAETTAAAPGNAQTISIECIMGSVKDAAAEDNCAKLAAYILNKYGLTIDKLYTHNYWCNVRNGKVGSVDQLNTMDDGYKGCPIYIRPHWYEFKTVVYNYMRQYASVPATPTEEVPSDPEYQYLVIKQLGAYTERENAQKHLAKLKTSNPNGYYRILKAKK